MAEGESARAGAQEVGRPLAPAALTVRRISSLAWALVLGTGAAIGELVFHLRPPGWPLAPGTASALLGLLLFVRAIVWPPLWYRHWRWQVRDRDVLLRFGVLFRTIRSVPRSRIQHVDLSQGPLQRRFGLYEVTLYTAGSGGADATIPGLSEAEALALRELLLDPTDEEGPRGGERPHG